VLVVADAIFIDRVVIAVDRDLLSALPAVFTSVVVIAL
jgi:hypothetical protein